jgi:hypothetical protein
MERISALIQHSTSNLMFDDEAFEVAESSSLAMTLYNVCNTHFIVSSKLTRMQFLSMHATILTTLTTHCATIKSTGPYYDSLSRSVNAQKVAAARFRAAVDARYSDVKVRTAQPWAQFDGVMEGLIAQYPLPADIMVVE